jgi:hypothetical protein
MWVGFDGHARVFRSDIDFIIFQFQKLCDLYLLESNKQVLIGKLKTKKTFIMLRLIIFLKKNLNYF